MADDITPIAATADIDSFIRRWEAADGSERANYQLFLTELVELLGQDKPDPASQDTEENAYVFERKVVFNNPDGSSSKGFIDLYKRGCFADDELIYSGGKTYTLTKMWGVQTERLLNLLIEQFPGHGVSFSPSV